MFRHAVFARPNSVVLVPLPQLTIERSFGVDLELMNVEGFTKQLLDRLEALTTGCVVDRGTGSALHRHSC